MTDEGTSASRAGWWEILSSDLQEAGGKKMTSQTVNDVLFFGNFVIFFGKKAKKP